MAKFQETFCSQCGGSFGPGDSGFSHCDQHITDAEIREQIMGSDLYSPGVKKAMQHFWDLLDKRREP